MERYHLRRTDRAIEDPAQMERILSRARYVTLAICGDGEPYLFVVNHGYDAAGRRIYFHCSPEGKKVDILRGNPRAWGIAVEDLGYVDGECEHKYRSVMFGGRVGFLESSEDKATALEVMIRQQESDPEPVMRRTLKPERLAVTSVGYVAVEEMSGKEALPD